MKAVILSLVISLANSSPQAGGDTIFQAMSDELSRSVEHLKIEKHDKPYYVSYRIDDSTTLSIQATFGSCTEDQLSRARMLSVDVHEGDYKLDSGNIRRGGWPEYNYDQLCLDDNYDAIRHQIWLRTDTAYKNAVQNLEKKKAILQQKTVKERPDDWSREQPLVLIQPKVELSPDRTAWKSHIKDLSSIFKDYPKISESKVCLKEYAVNRYFVNSEGSKSRVGEEICIVTATAVARADDSAKITDRVVIAAVDKNHMPAYDQMDRQIRQMAKRMTEAVEAKECAMYDGPVLLEGEAAAEFFNKILAPNVIAKRPPDTGRVTEDMGQSRIGRRILPTFISVVDDPVLKDESGTRYPGGSDVDDQGVKTTFVELVDKGILKTMLSTRLPTLKVKNSNGHSLGGYGQPRISNLVVKSDAALDHTALRAKLLDLGKENGLDYVLIVRKMTPTPTLDSRYGFAFDEDDMPVYPARNDRIAMPPIVDCVRLYLSDGHEELVRDAEFAPITLRILRDIVATGNDFKTYSQSDGMTNISTPSIILRDVEVQNSHKDADKPPVLTHPYFEK
ncbi:MAG: hypothetical protein JST01_28775 [Cyanobacteria bacterium SZAS TMP-1]|nr:hypothetical protein [Cyanobacteria bacterium SZAS TMP-1]